MSTQTVVVYTPFQDALYNGGMVVPLIGSLVAGTLLFTVLMMLAERFLGIHRVTSFMAAGIATSSVALAVLVFHWLAI